MQPDIFVQIPAYRDPQILPTIQSALTLAKYPLRVSIGVCWQYMPGEDEHMLPRMALPANVRLLTVPALESRGCCWARHKVQSLFQGEQYTLSVDSHTRFTPDWDVGLIDELNRCGSPKAIISNYPPGFTESEVPGQHASLQYMAATEFIDEGLPRFRSIERHDQYERPLRGLFIAGGFHFSHGSMIRDIPADPHLYFNQEEVLLAARCWTHGYDLYSPSKNFLFHLYTPPPKTADRRRLHWDDHDKWANWDRVAHKRAQHILKLKLSQDRKVLLDIDKYALGQQRDLSDFVALSGIDFRSEKVSTRAHNAEFVKELNPWLGANDYLAVTSIDEK
jgi:hypothetical protein